MRLGIRLVLAVLLVLALRYLVPPLLSLLMPFVLALVTAWLLNPLVRGLQRRLGVSRRLLSLLLILLAFAAAGGVLFGLGSGVGYALYSIFARFALERGYSSNTINFYSCLLAAVGAALIWGAREPVELLTASRESALLCLATGVVSCYLPYLLYTYGLTGLETGRASVMASVEPVVATLVGVVFFHEGLTASAAAGAPLVLAAVVLLNARTRRRTH